MSREKRDVIEMFDEFEDISLRVKFLRGIIQNEGAEISDGELMEWVDRVNQQINDLNSLKEDVVRYIQD